MTASSSNSENKQIPPASALDAINTDEATLQRRYVRIVRRQPNGLVAFEFSVGWPDMGCELVLPEALFNEFCIKNQVEFLTEAVGEKLGENNVEY
jgi:hypothetical protein